MASAAPRTSGEGSRPPLIDSLVKKLPTESRFTIMRSDQQVLTYESPPRLPPANSAAGGRSQGWVTEQASTNSGSQQQAADSSPTSPPARGTGSAINSFSVIRQVQRAGFVWHVGAGTAGNAQLGMGKVDRGSSAVSRAHTRTPFLTTPLLPLRHRAGVATRAARMQPSAA